jgi:hypothetical protein
MKSNRRDSRKQIRGTSLSKSEIASNVIKAALQCAPYIGPALDTLIFGHLDELRMKRFEETLREIDDELARAGVKIHRLGENYANLLEHTLPGLVRAVNDDKRKRFRDLLTNAAPLSDDSEWEEVFFSSDLLGKIESPGLAILAGAAKGTSELFSIRGDGEPQVWDGSHNEDRNANLNRPHYPLGYLWPIIEEWAHRLNQMRLLGTGGARGDNEWPDCYLMPLAKLFIKWTTRPDSVKQ